MEVYQALTLMISFGSSHTLNWLDYL
ncbi:putative holin-like toxin [Dehalobacter sp. DCM]